MENQEMLTIKEMAAKLSVKPSWLYVRTMRKGEGSIPRIMIGKYIRFNLIDVMAWIEEQYGNTNG